LSLSVRALGYSLATVPGASSVVLVRSESSFDAALRPIHSEILPTRSGCQVSAIDHEFRPRNERGLVGSEI
jgi:hypothetical protein